MRVHTIDLRHRGRPGRVASYLLIGESGPVLVETGATRSLPTLDAALAARGIEPREVRHVFVTHIHLDHAGAAGCWAERGATLYVHPLGAPHLVDPSRLVASATRLYGDRMNELWGEVKPAPAERVRAVADGEIVSAAGLEIEALATPGHASHHHVYRIGDIGFMGDIAGIVVPDSALVELPTPPPEFDLELWRSSLDRVRALDLSTIYPTHFGAVDRPEQHLRLVRKLVKEAAEVVRSGLASGGSRAEVEATYSSWTRDRLLAAGATESQLDELADFNPAPASAAGILRYWQKAHGLAPADD